MAEPLTKELLNEILNNPNPARQVCDECEGMGIISKLEVSKLDPGLNVLMWYRCGCLNGKAKGKK